MSAMPDRWRDSMQFVRLISVTVLCALLSHAAVNILTANGDNERTNSNLQETQLSPATVNASAFGEIQSCLPESDGLKRRARRACASSGLQKHFDTARFIHNFATCRAG